MYEQPLPNQPQGVRPSLFQAKGRCDQAGERIDDLARLLIGCRERHKTTPIRIQRHPNGVDEVISGGLIINDEAARLAGEVIYHLRGGLDRLIYSLAWLDSGREQDGTQFPIEDFPTRKGNRKGFADRRTTYLKGLNDGHVDMIELFQPYKGVEWTRVLRDLSNPDKHRKDVQVTLVVKGKMVPSRHNVTGAYGTPTEEMQMQMQGDFSLDIEFTKGGRPVLETLGVLQEQVGYIVGAFQADFGESDTWNPFPFQG